jgi:hypothetical protein
MVISASYTSKTSVKLINDGFNVIPVLDHLEEIDYYKKYTKVDNVDLGIRISTEEEAFFYILYLQTWYSQTARS